MGCSAAFGTSRRTGSPISSSSTLPASRELTFSHFAERSGIDLRTVSSSSAQLASPVSKPPRSSRKTTRSSWRLAKLPGLLRRGASARPRFDAQSEGSRTEPSTTKTRGYSVSPSRASPFITLVSLNMIVSRSSRRSFRVTCMSSVRLTLRLSCPSV